jgi:protein-L-isoaspartate(D-aspartate) O-methyltransferase
MLDRQGIGLTSQRARNRLVAQLRGMGIRAEEVLEIIAATPRHLFVDEALAWRAYENTALPIGFGQTISQPYVVAAMTELLWTTGSMVRVLEVGSGCGYQSAVLAQISHRVYGIERLAALVSKAQERLRALEMNNVEFCHGDGYGGWPEHAPFDAILVAAAAPEVPATLLAQLAPGGRLVMPVGAPRAQTLTLWERTRDGFAESRLDRVSFVPLLEGTG